MIYSTPSGRVYRIYESMLSQTHLLIAGATGSGKSTVVNGIISTALYRAPSEARFILIDPKRVELSEYADCPHTIRHIDRLEEIPAALRSALETVNFRYEDMRLRHLRTYDGSDIYLVIDELMPITTRADIKSACLPILQELLAISRAAKVHVIACTQSPITKVIPTELKCNFDSRVALRTATAQDSRNIIGSKGCETFPDPKTAGKALAYYRHGADTDLYSVPRIPDDERARLIAHWAGSRAFCA